MQFNEPYIIYEPTIGHIKPQPSKSPQTILPGIILICKMPDEIFSHRKNRPIMNWFVVLFFFKSRYFGFIIFGLSSVYSRETFIQINLWYRISPKHTLTSIHLVLWLARCITYSGWVLPFILDQHIVSGNRKTTPKVD